jgi:integrase
MITENYPKRDGRRVWLTRDDYAALIDVTDEPMHRVAFRLAGECGLRSDEVVRVTPNDVFDGGPVGTMLRVDEAKTGDRETPIPDGLVQVIEALGHDDEDSPVVDRTKRSVVTWMQNSRSQLLEEQDDDRWQYVTMHDLRRTWAGWLATSEVDMPVAMRWGGWDDIDTFLNHYRSKATPEAQAKEREKVDFL